MAKRLVNRRDKSLGNWNLTQAGIEAVEVMATGGMSLTSMAKHLRIDSATFKKIRKEQPEVEEAIERGYSEMEDNLVAAAYRRAMDDSRKDATTNTIFLLRSRRGYQGDKTPAHLTVINNDNRTQKIGLPSASDMDTYLRKVAEMKNLTLEGTATDA